MSNLAVVLEQENAVAVFSGNQMDETLKKIECEVLSFVPDTSTLKGRKEIASLANKVAKSKTALDGAGKTLTADWKAKAKLVDASRKQARDFLDDLKVKVRRPLTEWEDAEKLKSEQAAIKKEIEEAHAEAVSMNDLFNREIAIAEKERIAAEKEAETLRIEQEKQAEADRLENERQLKEQAAEQARLKAEQDAQAKIDEAKRLEAEAIAREETLKRQAVEAENKAKAEVERVEQARLQAIEDARIASENAVLAAKEQARIEAQQAEQKRLNAIAEAEKQAEIKASNKQHMREINNEALQSLINLGVDETTAKELVIFIAKGEVKNIIINY